MIEKRIVELQNGHVVEIHIENGRWTRLCAGCDLSGCWDAMLVPPEGTDGWTVRGRNSCSETEGWESSQMGHGHHLDYEAATALAMGFMVSRHDEFDYFKGRPYVSTRYGNGTVFGEALPESKAKREVRIAPDRADGHWVATCYTSYWDEEHNYFMMKPLEYVLGAGRGWEKERATEEGLHWLVNASFVGKLDDFLA